MPVVKPMTHLPNDWKAVDQMMYDMKFHGDDGKPTGLLAMNKFRKTIETEFPDMTEVMKKVDPTDARLNGAIYRDYGIMASAYMLEECHLNYLKDGNYGVGMDKVPRNIAVPLKIAVDNLKYYKPLHDYAYGYGLNNWKIRNDPNPHILEYTNEDLMPNRAECTDGIWPIRGYNNCEDEREFQLMHVAIVSKTHLQVQANNVILEGIRT
jgi:indoleamine 2,3-dioxygenase